MRSAIIIDPHGGPHIEKIRIRGMTGFAGAGTLGVACAALTVQPGNL